MPRPLWMIPPPNSLVEPSDKRALLTGFYWGGESVAIGALDRFLFSEAVTSFQLYELVGNAFNSLLGFLFRDESNLFAASSKEQEFSFSEKLEADMSQSFSGEEGTFFDRLSFDETISSFSFDEKAEPSFDDSGKFTFGG